MAVKRKKKVKPKLTPEQKRNSDIFRLRGFYANAKTLPFNAMGLRQILEAIDVALSDLGAQTQTDYMKSKTIK
jgi:hypothetical protein